MAKLKKSTTSLGQSGSSTMLLQPSFPKQKLSDKDKDIAWIKSNIDAIVSMGTQFYYNNRTSKYKKQVNYNIVNSIFDENDFEYVLNPYNVKDKLGTSPEKLQNFNIVRPALERLKGEELSRPFSFSAVAVGGESFNIKEQVRKQMNDKYVTDKIMSELANLGLVEPEVDEQGNPVQPKTPEKIDEFMRLEYKDQREITANSILKYLEYKEKFKLKFNKGWEHGLVAGEEVYYVGIISDEPVMRVVNPINFDYDRNPDLEMIEEAQWCREDRWLAKGQILDEFGEFLSDAELTRIDNGELSFAMPNSNMYPGYAYAPGDSQSQTQRQYNQNYYTHTSHIHVATCCWKSMRKIGFVSFVDEKGQEQEQVVQSDFKMPPELAQIGARLEWRWISEVFKGTRIGSDIYVDHGPIANQYRSMDNPSTCKLPYIGRVYNSLNSQSTSFVDLCKPHQYTYLIIWYRLLTEIAKSKGKKMVMDIAQIPKTQGFDMEKWMYYFDNLGIAFINSAEEGRDGDPSTVSKFNQFTAIDMSMSNTIGTYMQVIEKLETMMGELVGVNRQRMGDIKTSETSGNVSRAVTNSALITESMFYQHDLVKQQVLSQLVDCAKLAYIKGKRAQYVLDDGQRIFLQVDGTEFNDTEYGVFISNAEKDLRVKMMMEGMAQAALQNNKIGLSELVRIMNSNSAAEIESILVTGEAKSQQMAQQQQEAQMQHEKEIQQMSNDAAENQRVWESTEKQLDRQNKIETTQISAMGFDTNKDYNANNVPDILEFEKLRKMSQKDSMDYEIKKEQNQLKAEEIRLKHQQRMSDEEKNYTEQAQQNLHHNQDLEMKKKELEIKKKQANKPNKK